MDKIARFGHNSAASSEGEWVPLDFRDMDQTSGENDMSYNILEHYDRAAYTYTVFRGSLY